MLQVAAECETFCKISSDGIHQLSLQRRKRFQRSLDGLFTILKDLVGAAQI
jgi:hypothetical protein